ncbi:hydroxypyruvate isomerase [Xenophilus arseniciresistens]|uniref:Hydroxypyruvate isomerase n=1 Tax=Xenophilus arseniciresistens TaxID=1283306 RepID=A0AAE3SZ00_9BURK|nr:hydroxypyruvate isomerase [Xenophilus arseniciresistens]MDA7414772.1 hydroxypyruvate isomerase [Xenophilus arseniciresistens]
MPRFAANLSMLFTEQPFMQRFEAAARAGFEAVEYLFPYGFERHELLAALRANGLRQVLHNLPAGNWEAGERGIACHPDRIDEFREGVTQAIAYAAALDCPRLNCLAGKRPAHVSAEQAQATLVQNLRFAARALQAEGITLLVEPINSYDIPGFFLTRTDQALALLEEVGSPNLRIQYDIYHAQRTEGEIGQTLARHLPRIGHIQLADNPGRGEPGTGELNYPWLFRHIDALGYEGWIGCEYKPRARTEDGLAWLAPYRCA